MQGHCIAVEPGLPGVRVTPERGDRARAQDRSRVSGQERFVSPPWGNVVQYAQRRIPEQARQAVVGKALLRRHVTGTARRLPQATDGAEVQGLDELSVSPIIGRSLPKLHEAITLIDVEPRLIIKTPRWPHRLSMPKLGPKAPPQISCRIHLLLGHHVDKRCLK